MPGSSLCLRSFFLAICKYVVTCGLSHSDAPLLCTERTPGSREKRRWDRKEDRPPVSPEYSAARPPSPSPFSLLAPPSPIPVAVSSAMGGLGGSTITTSRDCAARLPCPTMAYTALGGYRPHSQNSAFPPSGHQLPALHRSCFWIADRGLIAHPNALDGFHRCPSAGTDQSAGC